MNWLRDEDIQEFVSKRNYDIRVSGNARWIDQKCTPDVLTIIADCILQYIETHPVASFSSADIWHNDYTVENVEAIFKKPNPDEAKARSEYDKFFQQPMEMLTYAGVFEKRKNRNRNIYIIADRDILEFLSIRERNALSFLQAYIEKVLIDSDLLALFENFFSKQTVAAYQTLKDTFATFTIQNTKIKGITECSRIFTKILNPLAYLRNKCGTERGHISKHRITYDMLMYNRDNFRDINSQKPKELTRKQFAEQLSRRPSSSLSAYMSQKAKRIVRAYNDAFRDGRSEIYDERHITDKAIHIHHIFPESEFPEICAFYENLIALTPTQHYSYAHPHGNTGRVDIAYQHICLIAKTSVIQETVQDLSREQIYEFGRFMHVLYIGLENDFFLSIEDNDFNEAIIAINLAYS